MTPRWLAALAGIGMTFAACGTADPDVRSFDAAPAVPGDGSLATSTTLDRITVARASTTVPVATTDTAVVTSPSEPRPTTATSSTVDSTVAEFVEPVILDAGAEPRTLLRFDPSVGSGTKQDERLVQHLKITASDLTDTVNNTVHFVSSRLILGNRAGVIDTKDTIEEVDLGSVSDVDFGTFSYRTQLDDRGRVLAVTHDPNVRLTAVQQSFLDALEKNWAQNAVVLPETPVGVGAVWRSSGLVPVISTTIPIERTIRITAIDGEVVHLEFDAVVDSELSDPDAMASLFPQGRVISVEVTATGSGTATIDLRQIVADQQFDLEMTFLIVAEVDGVEETIRMTVRQQDRVRVTAK